MDKKLKTGIFNVFSANIINLLLSLITSFLLPKYLSIEAYSIIKSFQLYINYAGLLHLGYVDGMYLKYGGIDYSDINKEDFLNDLSTMRIFQTIVTFLWIVIGVVTKDMIILAFGLAILPQNMNSYFRYLYQSVGEFKKYSRILNLTTIGTFFVNIVLLVYTKTNGIIYCILYSIIYAITWMILEINTKKKMKKLKILYFSIEHFKSNVKNGLFLMLGTFSSIILTSIDRWFVKFYLDNGAFAKYSFAVTMDNFINVLVTPISATLYNYFCRKKDKCDISKIKNYIMIFSIIIVSSVFPIKFILEVFLQKYYDSASVLFLLFCSQIFFIIVKVFYVNLYKVEKLQKKYFIKLLIIIFGGIIINIICFKIYPKMESYAFGTLISSYIWYLISINDFKNIEISFKDYIFPTIQAVLFIVCSFSLNSILGFLIYMILTSIFVMIFYGEIMIELFNNIRNRRKDIK